MAIFEAGVTFCKAHHFGYLNVSFWRCTYWRKNHSCIKKVGIFVSHEPGSKLLVLGMVIQPLIGNPYTGYINPYYWVDDHLDPSTHGVSGVSDWYHRSFRTCNLSQPMRGLLAGFFDPKISDVPGFLLGLNRAIVAPSIST